MRTRYIPTYLALALALSTPLAHLVGAEATALAQEEGRRVLKARQLDTGVDLSDEYARLATEKRLESIAFLKELLSQGDAEGERKAEMMLRLADLYFEQGRYLYLREMDAFDREYEKCFDTEGCNPDLLEPDNAESREWQEKSIRLYQQILRNYPRYARADEATYYLASALQDIGRREEAVDSFTRLVKRYPDSHYVPDSYVQIGEFYFDTNNAYKALLAYKKATAYRDSDKYAFALYKLAWCYYNVGEFGKAIDTMKSVVAFSMASQEGAQSATSKLQLQEEALKDLVRFFADAGEMDEAYEYFNKLGKKDLIRSMLKRLASMYFEQGKFEQCIQTYRRLIAEDPQSPDNPDYQNEIIQAYRKIGKKEQTLTEIDRMLKTYGKNSAWARANASNQDAVADALTRIEKNLRTVAIDYHQQAKKLGRGTSAKEAWALAYNAYRVYLHEFPESSHIYEVRYAFGELLWAIKKFDEAYDQYMAVVKIDPKGQHSRFCAESSIFAAEKMIEKEGGTQSMSASPSGVTEPLPLTEWEQKLVDACAQYADLYPEGEKVKKAIYKSGYLLYNKYRFEEAAAQFNRVIQMDPGSNEAEQAANLILDSFAIKEDWRNLQKNSKFYYEQEGLGSRSFKADVYNIYERASFRLIEVNFDADQDYDKAADAFVAFYEEFPESEVAAQALNNASVYYHKVQRIADSMTIRHILIEDPKFGSGTKYYYDQIAALGYDYETIADFDQAATYYEKLFSVYPKHIEQLEDEGAENVDAVRQYAADALYSAALFRKAQGDTHSAISNYEQFIAAFPTDERVHDVKLAIGRIYDETEDWSRAASTYYAFYTKATADTPLEYVFFARLHYGKALLAQGQTAKAQTELGKGVKEYERLIAGGGEPGAHTEFVAEMMFLIVQPEFDEFVDMQITGAGPGAGRRTEDRAIERSLKAKAQAVLALEASYKDIIDTGAGEWGVAALVQLGKVYENMGVSLENSHIPYYLTDDQREIYVMSLEDKVYVQTQKAIEAYRLALERSYALTLYNDDTAHATRQLGVLEPDEYPGLEEQLPDRRYTSQVIRTYDYEIEL